MRVSQINQQLIGVVLVCNLTLAGDLYEEDQILNWLMTQKDPGGDFIEDIEGERLVNLIEESGSMAVYFCKFSFSKLFSLLSETARIRGVVS